MLYNRYKYTFISIFQFFFRPLQKICIRQAAPHNPSELDCIRLALSLAALGKAQVKLALPSLAKSLHPLLFPTKVKGKKLVFILFINKK